MRPRWNGATNSSITLQWIRPRGLPVLFDFSWYERRSVHFPEVLSKINSTSNINDTLFTVTGLKPNQYYFFNLTVINVAGPGPASDFTRLATGKL